jgi:hypothetical protein
MIGSPGRNEDRPIALAAPGGAVETFDAGRQQQETMMFEVNYLNATQVLQRLSNGMEELKEAVESGELTGEEALELFPTLPKGGRGPDLIEGAGQSKTRAAKIENDPILVMLSKAGLETPTGAKVMGVMKMTPGIALINDDYGDGLDWDGLANFQWEQESKTVILNAKPVFVDNDDHTWVIDSDGRWQPTGVQLTFSDTLAEEQVKQKVHTDKSERRS